MTQQKGTVCFLAIAGELVPTAGWAAVHAWLCFGSFLFRPHLLLRTALRVDVMLPKL